MASQEKIKAVAYLRTNKSEVGDVYCDLHLQLDAILDFAKSRGMSVTKLIDDSGGSKHPRLYDVVEYCRSNEHVNTVIVSKRTKISRNVKDFQKWESIFRSIGVELRFVEQSVMGDSNKFAESLMTLIAQKDSEIRAEYIKRGLLKRVQAGYSVQKPPKGYVRTAERGLFAKDANTADYLHSCITRFLSGVLGYEELRRTVSAVFSSGKLLARSKVKTALTNPYYAGYVCFDGKQYKGLHEPLLTEAEYKQLTTLLDK